jgi:hypothetical protein
MSARSTVLRLAVVGLLLACAPMDARGEPVLVGEHGPESVPGSIVPMLHNHLGLAATGGNYNRPEPDLPPPPLPDLRPGERPPPMRPLTREQSLAAPPLGLESPKFVSPPP